MSQLLYEARRAANPKESEDSDAAVGNDSDDDAQSTQELGYEIHTTKKVSVYNGVRFCSQVFNMLYSLLVLNSWDTHVSITDKMEIFTSVPCVGG